MEQKYFVYDIKQHEWVETRSPKLTGEVDRLHKLLVGQDDKMTYANNDLLWAVADLSLFNLSYSVTNINAVIRWRIQAAERQQVVIIIGECCNLVEDKSHSGYNTLTENKKSRYQLMRNVNQISLRLDYKNWKYTAVPGERKQGNTSSFSYIYLIDWTVSCQPKYVAVPQPVAAAALEILNTFAENEFAGEHGNPAATKDVDVLKGFVRYPLDPNVAFWVDTLDYSFSLKVKRNAKNNFPLICEYLGLPENEDLQKVYYENSKSLVVIYYLKKYLKIEDENTWMMCYKADKLLNVNISGYGISKNGEIYDKALEQVLSYRDDDKMVKSIRAYYDWAMEKWNGFVAGKHVADIVVNWNKEMEALLMMLEENGYELTPETADLLKKLGLSKEAGDAVTAEYEANKAKKAEEADHDDGKVTDEFRLTKMELSREEKTSQGEFLAARNEADLWRITKALDNYAFMRAYDARGKKCTVYYFQQRDVPVVYIEIRKGAVVTAAGKGDARLAGVLLDEVKLWAFKHKLVFKA